MGLSVFIRTPLALILTLLMVLATLPPSGAGSVSHAEGQLHPYLVRLAEPDVLVPVDRLAPLAAQSAEQQRSQLSVLLDRLVEAGLAGTYSFDEAENGFRATLTGSARDTLAGNPLVASVEVQADETYGMASASSPTVGIQAISSVTFIQVYTPFVWGRVSVNGLTVQLTLEDGDGNTKGVPVQGTTPGNIVIDRTQLYYETLFTDPTSHAQVNILPGDRVHVVTTGIDPVAGLPATDDRRIVVDDVRAWTSYEQDSVVGTAPPNSEIIVTNNSSFPTLSNYLTPGSSVTYAELTATPDGTFIAPLFRTTSDPTYKKIGIKQGNSGFVRVHHPDGNEVYTVHGQNVLVLENSYTVHGYAFGIPSAPSSPPLDLGVKVTRPANKVTVTLKNSAGGVKNSSSPVSTLTPYFVDLFPNIIGPEDIVEVSLLLNQGQPNVVRVASLTANADIEANQITGGGPANTQIVLGAGLINGYISESSTFNYIEKRVTTSSNGSYASGQFQCGSSELLKLQPGSFGYAGYEDTRGNFIYMSFAVPINYVMADFPFLEGWVANGAIRPDITLRSSGGSTKHAATALPLPLYMTTQKLVLNTYYQMQTSQFIVPGDTVSIVSGTQAFTIPVDKITAYVNTDNEIINGEAPAGSTVRVINSRADGSASKEVVADASGAYAAGNPFSTFSTTNCSISPKIQDFTPGDLGRAYVLHADANQVFAAYGRSLHVQENTNYIEVYPVVAGGLDWSSTPSRPISVTVTPKQGAPVSASKPSSANPHGQTKFTLTTGGILNQPVLIRVGDSVAVSFDEGPVGTTRPVALSLNSLALVTGTPDVDTNTLAGVGPRGWSGQATIVQPTTAASNIMPSAYTAYAPVNFLNAAKALITMEQGYSGLVSFSNTTGNRIWTAWAVTAYPVKIIGWLRPGDTKVCGKAPPGGTVRIHDVTQEGQDIIIGTGTADAQGNYCVYVNPPLYEGEVILAEVDGTYSQPVIIRPVLRVILPNMPKY